MGSTDRVNKVAALFDQVADTYDNVGVPWFTPIAQRLVAELAPAPGESALDIGCGRGAALWPLAEAVGPDGRVVGIDLAPRMVEITRADADRRGLPHVELHVMDATDPLLPAESFDVLASSLVLFFLPEPLPALQRWVSLLVPDGRIGISSFGARTPEWVALDDLFTPFLPPDVLDARTSGARGPFASDAGVEELFAAAGLQGVRTVGFPLRTTFDDIGHWQRWSMSHGQRMMWRFAPEDQHGEILRRAEEILGSTRDEDGRIELVQQVRLTLGRR